ncbi:probable insulin-like peptide 7 [Diorhabda carinulata]|uniref:probable insulin-like peptide 7 n=1 Tax=Diorhabda carinulata TaxID=1163345 RepID=UPI0025A1CAE7|nr:probable insulin-like peptide 7 [Diorhabda carinulata]
MWLRVSTIAAICVFIDITDGAALENDLEAVFRQRTHSDWTNAWHQEKFSRCRDTLVKHLYWACEKDIYRITRRRDPSLNIIERNEYEMKFPWHTRTEAYKILRFRRNVRRRSGSSITHECCKSTGCTWEEYAEYCPTNKRYTTYVRK